MKNTWLICSNGCLVSSIEIGAAAAHANWSNMWRWHWGHAIQMPLPHLSQNHTEAMKQSLWQEEFVSASVSIELVRDDPQCILNSLLSLFEASLGQCFVALALGIKKCYQSLVSPLRTNFFMFQWMVLVTERGGPVLTCPPLLVSKVLCSIWDSSRKYAAVKIMKWVRWLCRIMYGAQARFFADEIFPTLRHKKKGLVSMAGGGKDMNASQFFITTGTDLDSLDEKHTIFGEVYLCLMQLMAGAQASLRLELCLECIAGPMFTLIWQLYLDCHFRCRLSCFWIQKLLICRVKTTYISVYGHLVYTRHDFCMHHVNLKPCVSEIAILKVTEGFDELEAINSAFVDGNNRPLQNIRIRHTVILEDPFPDPSQLADHIPEKSPEPEFASEVRILAHSGGIDVPKSRTLNRHKHETVSSLSSLYGSQILWSTISMSNNLYYTARFQQHTRGHRLRDGSANSIFECCLLRLIANRTYKSHRGIKARLLSPTRFQSEKYFGRSVWSAAEHLHAGQQIGGRLGSKARHKRCSSCRSWGSAVWGAKTGRSVRDGGRSSISRRCSAPKYDLCMQTESSHNRWGIPLAPETEFGQSNYWGFALADLVLSYYCFLCVICLDEPQSILSLKGKTSHCRPCLLMPAAYQTPMAWTYFCSFRSHALCLLQQAEDH